MKPPSKFELAEKLHQFQSIFSAFDDISTNLANDIRGSYYCMARNKLGSDFGNRINVRMPIRYTPTMLKQKGTLSFKILKNSIILNFQTVVNPHVVRFLRSEIVQNVSDPYFRMNSTGPNSTDQ